MVDGSLYVVEHPADDPGAPVVVLVHGVFDSSASFDATIEHLLPEHTVITYDRRGWARSVDLPPATSLDDHARDLFSALGDRRATLVGHSYGGTVASLASIRRPDLVAALGMFEPSMQWQPWWPPMEVIAAQAPEEQAHFRFGLEGRPRRTPEEREREQAQLAHELALIAAAPYALDDLVVPCVVGRGAVSARWRFATTDQLRDALGCELIVIDDAGHTAHRMQPKGFADFVRRTVALGREAD